MGYLPGPQMGPPAKSSNVDIKEKLTIIVATLALLVSVGAMLASVNSCRQSTTSNEIAGNAYGVAQRQEVIASSQAIIASSQAALAQREAEGAYAAAFTVVLQRGGGRPISKEVSWPEEEDFIISKNELLANTTWLGINITNTGNRSVVIDDIGLVTNRKDKTGVWARTHGYQMPDYCGGDWVDIRCYQFSLTVPVGGYLSLKWPVWLDADSLLKQSAANPVVVGININNHNSPDIYETNLVVR